MQSMAIPLTSIKTMTTGKLDAKVLPFPVTEIPQEIKTLKVAEAIVGGLSEPSKMPSVGTSLPAKMCKVGSKLRLVIGSVCHGCYAWKGMYAFGNTQKALHRRLNMLTHRQWVDAMVFIMHNKKAILETGVFRWHDSGDIQSMDHLLNIVEVAKKSPKVKHWIPTKEKGLLMKLVRNGVKLPKNLIIRLSGAMVDGEKPNFRHTSTVTTDPKKATCHAYRTVKEGDTFRVMTLTEFKALPQKHGLDSGHCGECRKCWNSRVKNTVYLKH